MGWNEGRDAAEQRFDELKATEKKAVRLVADGHVTILSPSPIVGRVRGDHATYLVCDTPDQHSCTCLGFFWGRDPCSHVIALRLAVYAKDDPEWEEWMTREPVG